MSEQPSLQEQQDAFEAYKAARAKVDATMDFQDAIAAGKAWGRFLDVYLGECKRPSDRVIPFPVRNVSLEPRSEERAPA